MGGKEEENKNYILYTATLYGKGLKERRLSEYPYIFKCTR